MTAGEAREMGHEQVTVVTPEHTPLSLFGDQASEAVGAELRWAGVEVRTGAVAQSVSAGLRLEPNGDLLDVQRVFAVPASSASPSMAFRPTTRGSFAPAMMRSSKGTSGRGPRVTASSRR